MTKPAPESAPRVSDGLLLAALGLALRGALALYGAAHFPPADDGTFYHTVAGRIAQGLGYTWAWDDGAVTYAAHYPVGYPALLGAFYAVFGARPGVAMALNATLGALAVWGAHTLAARVANRRGAVVAGLLLALEPALVLYTPALMTEAVAGELVLLAAVVATAPAPRLRWRVVASGAVLGLGLLVRPQLLLVAPVVGALVAWREPGLARAARTALGVTAVSVLMCLPWTLRNCARLDSCAFVSANGGWNLFIGTSSLGDGGWAPLEKIGVPPACRTVFAEGAKDRCFGRAGLEVIRDAPLAWLALVPKKLAVTFDYGTAAAHYLSASNPKLIGEEAKVAIGAAELLGQRVVLLAATLALGLTDGPRRRWRRWLVPVAVVALLSPSGWLGWMALFAQGALLGSRLFALPQVALGVSLVGASALTHAVFFGAGRYALVCLPSLAVVPALLWQRRPSAVD